MKSPQEAINDGYSKTKLLKDGQIREKVKHRFDVMADLLDQPFINSHGMSLLASALRNALDDCFTSGDTDELIEIDERINVILNQQYYH